MSNLHKIHDTFIRDFLSKKEEAIPFLEGLLPEDISKDLLLQNLEVESSSFIDENMKEYYSDILFTIPLKQGKYRHIYLLFEHKSYRDKNIHKQLLKYICEIHAKQMDLIPVQAVVFYHGKKDWKIKTKFSEAFSLEYLHIWKNGFLDFEFHLIDLNSINLDQLKINLTTSILLNILKIVNQPKPEENLFLLFNRFREIFQSQNHADFIRKIILYIFRTTGIPKNEMSKLIDCTLTKSTKEDIMTTLEKMIQEGKQKGIYESKLETARKMMEENLPLDQILRFTGLSKEDLQKAGMC